MIPQHRQKQGCIGRNGYHPASAPASTLLGGALAVTLLIAGCATADLPTDTGANSADAPLPPDAVSLSELPDPEPSSSAPVAPDDELTPQVALFPGLEHEDDKALPFEEGVAERRKRVDLGLEAPRQENAPVNNVLQIEF